LPTPKRAETTAFSLDIAGRYVCNGLDEAIASTTGRPDARRFDIVIVGGGTFGAAIAEHLWFRDQQRRHRILVLEAGPVTLQEHVQNTTLLGLDVPGASTIAALKQAERDNNRSDADPLPARNEVWGLAWQSSTPFPGLAYTLGGRSLYWGGWSPRLLPEELTSWPPEVVQDLDDPYFDESARQLGVTETNDFMFGELHTALRQQLHDGLGTVANAVPLASLPDFAGLEGGETVDDLVRMLGLPSAGGASAADLRNLLKLEAPLAVEGAAPRAGFFPLGKFSSIPLLIKAARAVVAESNGDDVNKRLMVVPRCHTTRLNVAPSGGGAFRVTSVVTDQGVIELTPEGVVIIALGTIESTRLALTSFENVGLPTYDLIGRNLMAHLRSNLTIRIPREAIANLPAIQELQTSALFVKGKHTHADGTTGYFHLQITASGLGAVGRGSEAELFKKVPDIDFFEQHAKATDTHVVITIRGIGEMTPFDPAAPNAHPSRVVLDPSTTDEYGVKRAFVTLGLTDNDRALWTAMDQASDAVARVFANGHSFDVLLDSGDKTADATTDLSTVSPFVPKAQNPAGRRDGMGTTHHECGTLWMGSDPARSVTDTEGRFHGTDNLYTISPALFPTVGSPNPMLTGIALARRMGDRIVNPPPVTPDAGFTLLFDGTTLNRWRMSTIRNQPGRDDPGSFIVSGGALEARTGTDLGLLWYTEPAPADFVLRLEWMRTAPGDNSGVFLRFPHPEQQNYDNTAYVAITLGLEVQIDEEARPDGAGIHRTGGIYKLAAPDLNLLNVRNVGEWNLYEITVQGNRYTVVLNGQEVTRFDFTPGSDPQFPKRALAPTATEPRFIGLQTHTGRVRFRKIQWKAL
jgi:choline dehydrogenase-like flavoprotein